MLRITINSYLILRFLSNLPELKILRINFSYLIKNGFFVTNFSNMQKLVIIFTKFR